jgi:hypothetical protein
MILALAHAIVVSVLVLYGIMGERTSSPKHSLLGSVTDAVVQLSESMDVVGEDTLFILSSLMEDSLPALDDDTE